MEPRVLRSVALGGCSRREATLLVVGCCVALFIALVIGVTGPPATNVVNLPHSTDLKLDDESNKCYYDHTGRRFDEPIPRCWDVWYTFPHKWSPFFSVTLDMRRNLTAIAEQRPAALPTDDTPPSSAFDDPSVPPPADDAGQAQPLTTDDDADAADDDDGGDSFELTDLVVLPLTVAWYGRNGNESEWQLLAQQGLWREVKCPHNNGGICDPLPIFIERAVKHGQYYVRIYLEEEAAVNVDVDLFTYVVTVRNKNFAQFRFFLTTILMIASVGLSLAYLARTGSCARCGLPKLCTPIIGAPVRNDGTWPAALRWRIRMLIVMQVLLVLYNFPMEAMMKGSTSVPFVSDLFKLTFVSVCIAFWLIDVGHMGRAGERAERGEEAGPMINTAATAPKAMLVFALFILGCVAYGYGWFRAAGDPFYDWKQFDIVLLGLRVAVAVVTLVTVAYSLFLLVSAIFAVRRVGSKGEALILTFYGLGLIAIFAFGVGNNYSPDAPGFSHMFGYMVTHVIFNVYVAALSTAYWPVHLHERGTDQDKSWGQTPVAGEAALWRMHSGKGAPPSGGMPEEPSALAGLSGTQRDGAAQPTGADEGAFVVDDEEEGDDGLELPEVRLEAPSSATLESPVHRGRGLLGEQEDEGASAEDAMQPLS